MIHRRRLARLLPAVAACLAVVAAVRAPARADDGMDGGEPAQGTSREFPEHNFQWTLPAKWELSDPSDDDKSAGYVAMAKRVIRPGVEATAFVLVRDSGGASVQGNLEQVRDNKSRKLTDVDAKIESTSWAGAEQAHVLRLLGKAENKSVIASLVYGGIVAGKYHQLDIKSVNGANHEIESELQAVAKGYRFLTGAKADEEPQPPAPGGEPAAADPLKKRFEKLGLTWTLPPAPPPVEPPPGSEGKEAATYDARFTAEGNANIAPLDAGIAAVALLLKDGAPAIVVVLELPKAQPDASATDVIRNERNFEGAKDNFDGTPIPAMDGETKVGNAPGASRTMSGKGQKDGRPLWVRWYATTVKRQLYFVRVEAHERAETTNKDWMHRAVAGLHWDDASSGVRGPFVAPFASASEPRGAGWLEFNEKKPFKHSTVTLTKPAPFGRLKFVATDDPYKPWVFAAEAREPGALLFVGIEHFDVKAFQSQKKEPESLIDDFENEWKNTIDEPKTRPKSDKVNKKPDSFRGGKGASYEFSGTKEGNPVFERGWVVKAGQNVFWVRSQFVGKDAEKALSDDWDALMKTIKFE